MRTNGGMEGLLALFFSFWSSLPRHGSVVERQNFVVFVIFKAGLAATVPHGPSGGPFFFVASSALLVCHVRMNVFQALQSFSISLKMMCTRPITGIHNIHSEISVK